MITIIGAGLSGLLLGYRLKSHGIPFRILEARHRIGGRIHTVVDTNGTPVEMGATWFNRDHHQLIHLLDELEVGYFEQFMSGVAFYQPSSEAAISPFRIPEQAPSYRIEGGTATLIKALHTRLDKADIILHEQVDRIEFTDKSVNVIGSNLYQTDKVVLALPPKLWAKHIHFSPGLPDSLIRHARQTQTWMEGAIKVALTFKHPFWRNKNQSGTFFSNAGPVTELYDHSNKKEDKYALCGFVTPNSDTDSKNSRKELMLKQLKLAFGDEVSHYVEYIETDWRKEAQTFTLDRTPLLPHQNNGNPVFRQSFFDHRLFISSTESSHRHPGYMEGAIASAEFVLKMTLESNAP